MAKIKYYYDTKTLSYKRIELNAFDKLKRSLAFLSVSAFAGFIMVIGYFTILPFILSRTLLKSMYEAYGPIRYGTLMFFGLSMLGLPIKMYLRWMFNLKYIIAIPEWFFNI